MSNVSLTVNGRNLFDEAIERSHGGALRGATLSTVQVNIGLVCNLACHHCHVESSPKRDEAMDWATLQRVLDVARETGASTIDITGGAPEMHPHFRWFVEAARAQGREVMVRTNLTIMLEEGYTDLPAFFREQRVHLIASLPCYLEENVDKQRGRHVYVESIDVIKQLNAQGFGTGGDLVLDLVYNPVGAGLPPEQASLEADYKRELSERFGITFDHLFTITNMPIGRFMHDLERDGKADGYTKKLRDNFNPGTIDGLMCRHQLHVGHDGTLYDCDFNFAISLPVQGLPRNIHDLDVNDWIGRRIATGDHCFGCTAGAGSSCTGALA